jgi:phosphoglycerol transferase MdoB-like AlkP superfamily enzyme
MRSVLARLRSRVGRALQQSGLLHFRTRLPALVLATVIALCMLERLILLVLYSDRFSQIPWSRLAEGFAVGLRFDLVVAGMLVAPLLPLVCLAPPRLVERHSFKRAVGSLAGVLLGLTTALLGSDALFFGEFGERLNYKVLNYASGAGNEYVWQVILEQFPVLPLLGLSLVVGVATARLVTRLGFDDRQDAVPLWHAVVWPLVLATLVGLGIRGTVGSHAINTGPAYFAGASTPLSQLTLNGLFTLRQAVYAKTMDFDASSMYEVVPREEVDRRARELVLTHYDEPIDDPLNPLLRRTEGVRPRRDLNVVLVVLEGMHWSYVGHLGGRPGLTPNLDALARAGVHTQYAYAVGGRTQRGFAGIVSSFPDIPVVSVTTRNEVAGSFLTLPGLLKQRGYQTLFIYGGPALRDHRQTFLGSNGVDRFVVEDDLPVRTFRTSLGWNDRDLFRSAIQVLNGLPRDRPFFSMMLTLTFHRPYEFPGSESIEASSHSEERQFAALRFCDEAIGEFMDSARQQDWFDHTIFVFVADHRGGVLQFPNGPPANRIPMIFYGPGIEGLEPRSVGGVRSQMDLAPTVMGLLGGSYEHTFFGRDLLRGDEGRGYAVTVDGDGELSFYSGQDTATVIPPGNGTPLTWQFDPESGELRGMESGRVDDVRDGVALMELAARLFYSERYNLATGQPASRHATTASNTGSQGG